MSEQGCKPRPLKPHELARWRAWCKNPDDFQPVNAPPLNDPCVPLLPTKAKLHVVVERGRSRRPPEPFQTGTL